MYRRIFAWISFLAFAFVLHACSGGNSSTQGTTDGDADKKGFVSVSLTDAPGDYDHAYITVTGIWFHASDNAEEGDSGWQKFPLDAAITVDLLTLSGGRIGSPIWNNITLPAGAYKQIRIVLAGTEDALNASAQTAGLQYNNEVILAGDAAHANHYPLKAPDARHGIRLSGEFVVTDSGALNIAIDFDAHHDIVEVQKGSVTEYILKPRLSSYDLDDAGAITGTLVGNDAVGHFVIKAEQPAPDGLMHMVRRATMIADRASGKFVLFPLKPGTYDLIMRGIGHKTVIVKGVPAAKGTTPNSSPTIVPPITMETGTDYLASGKIISPTGAWAHFCQTLPGAGEVPYEVRFRHFNPFIGEFKNFHLSNEPILVGTYVDATTGITLTPATPVEGIGGFTAVAGAMMYEPMTHSDTVTSSTGTITFGSLSVKSPAKSSSVSGAIIMPEGLLTQTFDKGVVFAVRGGMILNAINVDSAMQAGGGPYAMQNMPGGFPGALYGIEAIGWSADKRAVSAPAVADSRFGDDMDFDLRMVMLP